MFGEPYIGILIGATLTFISTYFFNKISEKREKEKRKIEEENKAVTEVYSPLTFILDKNRELFAKLLGLKKSYDILIKNEKIITHIENNETSMYTNAILKYAFHNIDEYKNIFQELLYKKLGLIKPDKLRSDILLYQFYISTLVDYCNSLLILDININTLMKVLNNFIPVLEKLERATSNLKITALRRTERIIEFTYESYFTDDVCEDIDNALQLLNISLFGVTIPDWDEYFKK